jgi:outer membrane immunogenic protein
MKPSFKAAIAASTFLSSVAAAHSADMPVKAPPPAAASAYSWAGTYVGLNAGASLDRDNLGQLRLTSPGFVFIDPNGAFAGFPSPFFGFPGGFQSVPFNQSRAGVSFIGGGQAGHNWQSGNIVYGLEGDVQGLRSRDSISASLLEFTPGLFPTANITRNTFANFSIERQWEASLRGRFGYAWGDRLLAYATGGLAVTSIKTATNYTFQTIIGPALAPFPAAPPQNFSAAGVGSRQDYLGVTFGGGLEYALTNNLSIGGEYRFTDFGKRNVILGVAPGAGVLLPPTSVELPVHLFSQQVTARLNYHFGAPSDDYAAVTKNAKITKAPVTPTPASNWTGCYVGGYAGVAWSRSPVDTFDPSTDRSVFGPPPFLQTTFYDSSAGESARPAPYSYDLNAGGMGGGTLGCNWQAPSSRLVWGVEAEGGVMHLTATVNNAYNLAFGFNDTTDSTKVGNLYGVVAGRVGHSVDQMLFYLKGGVGFTHVAAESLDLCSTTGATCSSQTLIARGSANPAFFVAGGGAEWAFTEKWSAKAEYLYLGLDNTFAACGPGGGRLFVPNLTFCSNHSLDGIHTVKVGLNYKLN